jgi:hypothetical protein
MALEWAAARDDPKRANRIFKKHQAFYKEIRDLEDGKRALESLLGDPEPPVRLLAATHSLRLVPDLAQAVLAELERGAGVYAMDAKYTLINYRAGRLDLDW